MYLPCERTLILLFPEGGFLRKRREVARKFALQNNLPVLNYTTIPRVGAVQNMMAVIGPKAVTKTMSNGYANNIGKIDNETIDRRCAVYVIAYRE